MGENIEREGMLAIGTTLSNGKYRVEKYISSGGFGNTYLATDTAFDEKVAIKELFIKGICGRHENSTDVSISLTENQRTFAAQQEKFRKEAKRLRKLNNDHIVKVHDLFDDNGTSYYVMDFIEGESLSAKLKRTGKPMTESEVMLILPQILDALETVHKEQIWHLDLKPANIMIDKHGNVQLIDFGASKQLRSADGNSLSTSSALAYTPGYASSEQMEQNYEKFGPWTDLYSLGATIYNLLTRNMPPSPSDIAENPEKALPLPKEISRKTHDLVLWLMRPLRTMRPQCVADVRSFLKEELSIPIIVDKGTNDDSVVVAVDEDTLVVDGNTDKKGEEPKPQPKPTPKKKTNNVGKPDKKKGYTISSAIRHAKKRKVLVAGCVVAILVACAGIGFGIGMFGSGSTTEEVAKIDTIDTVVVDTVPTAKGLAVSISQGPEDKRKYTYTGEIDKATKLPNGHGTAVYPKYGNILGAIYQGKFNQGVCHDDGQAILTFDNGDVFTGSFYNGYYNRGTYKLADGSYFTGTFSKGNPYTGSWYTAGGKPDGDVVKGVER